MAESKKDRTNKRQYIRFHSGEMNIALISLTEKQFSVFDEETIQFEGNISGLVLDESFRGCSLVILSKQGEPDFMKVATRCIIKVGNQEPLQGEIKWCKNLDPQVLKVGFELFDFEIF